MVRLSSLALSSSHLNAMSASRRASGSESGFEGCRTLLVAATSKNAFMVDFRGGAVPGAQYRSVANVSHLKHAKAAGGAGTLMPSLCQLSSFAHCGVAGPVSAMIERGSAASVLL